MLTQMLYSPKPCCALIFSCTVLAHAVLCCAVLCPHAVSACPQSYAFLEMRSVEEASNAMALDGVVYKDTNLKVRLSAMYDEMLMLALPLCR
jgi:hypothetical protein